MSVMEKALRQIDEQRLTSRARVNPEDYLSPEFPASPRAPRDLRNATWLTIVACVAAGGWYIGSPRDTKATSAQTNVAAVVADAPPALAVQTAAPAAASAAQPVAAKPDTDAPRPDKAPPAPAWLVQASHVWAAGLHQDAARLWLNGLRTLPSTSLALLVAEHQTLAQARALHAKWSAETPLVVLSQNSGTAKRWMLLALPPAGEIDRVQQRLSAGLGGPVTWGSVAQWVAPLVPSPAEPAANTDTKATQASAPATAPKASASPVTASAQPATAVKAPAVATPAPSATATATATATAAPAPRSAPAPAATAPAAGPAAAIPSASRPGEPVQISRSDNASERDKGRVAPASRAIDADYQHIEQLLARGEHGAALDSAQKLEQQIGVNWRTRYLHGVALSGLGRWPEATAALGEARQKNAGHARVALYLAVALQETRDHARALEVLASATERHPELPELWLNQGHSLQALGRQGEATQAYQRFLTLSANRPDLQVQREWVQGRLAKDN